MSIISSGKLNNFYAKDPSSGWFSVKEGSLQYKGQAIEVAKQCASDARMERLKAITKGGVAGGSALALGALAYLALKVSTYAVAIFVFPLAIIPPLYGLVTTLAGVAAGTSILYLSTKKYSKPFFEQAKEHWNYADHLFAQAHSAKLKAPGLASDKA